MWIKKTIADNENIVCYGKYIVLSWWDEVKCHILKKAKSFILLTFLNISFFLNSARIFFFLALSFFLSSFQSSGRVLWQYENATDYASFALLLSLFFFVHLCQCTSKSQCTNYLKVLEILGNIRVWKKMKYLERMRNTQCITKCYLGYLCYSHEVEKTERLRS